MAELTPFQTVGPFFAICLSEPGCAHLGTTGAAGRRIVIDGSVRDGAGTVVSDALIEIWQANAAGRYAHPDDHQSKPLDPEFAGYGRAPTDHEGRFCIESVMPGRVPGPDDMFQAPHLVLSNLARGIHTRLVARIYFDDEPSTNDDPILSMVPPERRSTLIAKHVGGDRYRFDLVLQGEGETVFFDV